MVAEGRQGQEESRKGPAVPACPLTRAALCGGGCESSAAQDHAAKAQATAGMCGGSRHGACTSPEPASAFIYSTCRLGCFPISWEKKTPLLLMSKDQTLLGWFVTLRAPKKEHGTGRNSSPEGPDVENHTFTEMRKFESVICLQSPPFLHLPALKLSAQPCGAAHRNLCPIKQPCCRD